MFFLLDCQFSWGEDRNLNWTNQFFDSPDLLYQCEAKNIPSHRKCLP